MTIAHSILLLARNEKDKGIQGRTLIQKRMFFLSELLKEEMGFRAHFYGPYSSEVATDLDRMVMAGFLSEETKVLTAGSNPFEGVRCYTYRLTEDGNELVGSWLLGTDQSKMKEEEEALQVLEKEEVWRNTKHLVVAAKLFFLQKELREPFLLNKYVQKAKEYGWDITKGDVEIAQRFLKSAGFLKK